MRTFALTSRPLSLGGGYSVKLYRDGEEEGGGVFPLDAFREEARAILAAHPEDGTEDDVADLLAYEAAYTEGDAYKLCVVPDA